MSLARIGTICLSLMLPAGVAVAQDVAAGSQLARIRCTGCHQVGQRPQAGIAPSFVDVAATRGMTQLSIQVFLRTPHDHMPNYVLSEKQIADVAAYIISLRGNDRDLPVHGSDPLR